MIKKIRIVIVVLFICSCGIKISMAQSRETVHLSLDEVINIAHVSSLDAMIAKHNFMASYWEFRSYRAQLLPSVNLNGNLANFNRSITALQSAETGELKYVENYNLRNNISLSIDQNIPFTGGTVSLYSSLERIDQYGIDANSSYYSQPISVSYTQPIGGYNAFKWEKKIEPKKYELSKRIYVESMENVTINAVSLFFGLMIQQNSLNIAKANYTNTNTLYDIAKQRFKIGTISKNDLLQLELRLLNDSMTIKDVEIDYALSNFKLRNYLAIYNDEEIILNQPKEIPNIEVDYTNAMELWQLNSSFAMDSEISILDAQSNVARQKGTGGVEVMLNARFGFTQTSSDFSGVYQNLLDQEVVGLSVKVPILDWGQRRGRIKMAKSLQQVVQAQITKDKDDKLQELAIFVMRLNAQSGQCAISLKANDIADERYMIVMERFRSGSISVTEANQAQEEQDSATRKYLDDLQNYWVYYFNLRRLTLYDYMSNKNIVREVDESMMR